MGGPVQPWETKLEENPRFSLALASPLNPGQLAGQWKLLPQSTLNLMQYCTVCVQRHYAREESTPNPPPINPQEPTPQTVSHFPRNNLHNFDAKDFPMLCYPGTESRCFTMSFRGWGWTCVQVSPSSLISCASPSTSPPLWALPGVLGKGMKKEVTLFPLSFLLF